MFDKLTKQVKISTVYFFLMGYIQNFNYCRVKITEKKVIYVPILNGFPSVGRGHTLIIFIHILLT